MQNEKNTNLMEETQSICDRIIEVSPHIRFVGIITDNGRLVEGKKKDGIKLLVDEKHNEMLFMEVALRVRMRREFDSELGPTQFTISRRDKVVIMSFPFDDDIVYISAEKGVDLAKLPFMILQVMEVQCN